MPSLRRAMKRWTSRDVSDSGYFHASRDHCARAAGGRRREGAGDRGGSIADARDIVAAFALGASAVQFGTAYRFVNRIVREMGPMSD